MGQRFHPNHNIVRLAEFEDEHDDRLVNDYTLKELKKAIVRHNLHVNYKQYSNLDWAINRIKEILDRLPDEVCDLLQNNNPMLRLLIQESVAKLNNFLTELERGENHDQHIDFDPLRKALACLAYNWIGRRERPIEVGSGDPFDFDQKSSNKEQQLKTNAWLAKQLATARRIQTQKDGYEASSECESESTSGEEMTSSSDSDSNQNRLKRVERKGRSRRRQQFVRALDRLKGQVRDLGADRLMRRRQELINLRRNLRNNRLNRHLKNRRNVSRELFRMNVFLTSQPVKLDKQLIRAAIQSQLQSRRILETH